MEGLYLGIELTDRGCRISAMDPHTKKVQTISEGDQDNWVPCLLCYDLEEDRWLAGDLADQKQGDENCLVLYRLLSLFVSGQPLVVNELSFSADYIMQKYFEQILAYVKDYYNQSQIPELAVCIEGLSLQDGERLLRVFMNLGFSGKHVHILNPQECFSYYITSLNKEYWTNACFMLNYDARGLSWYDLSVYKNVQPPIIHTIRKDLTEVPDISGIFGDEMTREQADEWFLTFIEQALDKRIVNSVLLSGEGFADYSWAKKFLHTVSGQKSRKLFQVSSVFSMGAACAAYHMFDEENRFPYTCICDDRITVSVSIQAENREGKNQLVLASMGTNYKEARTSLELLLEEESEIELLIRDAGTKTRRKEKISLASFLSQGQDRIRIRLQLGFLSDSEMMVHIEDLGFGGFYPSSGKVIQLSFQV